METKYYYKGEEYSSKLDIIAKYGFTSNQLETLINKGIIKNNDVNDFQDFAGIHVAKKYEYQGMQFENMEAICKKLGISKRRYAALRKTGEITSINNQKNVAGYDNKNSK